MIRFKCPQCGGSLEAPESNRGEETNCLSCGYLLQIPTPQDDFFRFLCPSCGQRLKAKPKDTGRKTQCAKCGTRFLVPAIAPPSPVKGDFPNPEAVIQQPASANVPFPQGVGPMPIAISCPNCGLSLKAPESAFGKRFKCRKCNRNFVMPARPGQMATQTSAVPVPRTSTYSAPVKLIAPERGLSIIVRPLTSSPHFIAFAAASAMLVVLLSIWIVGIAAGKIVVPWLCLIGAIGIFLLIAYSACSFNFAKARAIQERKREVEIFFGLARLVLWEANEGLLFLKNKRVCDVIYGHTRSGGTAIIFPTLGEELRIHVPLTFRPCEFRDYRVLSRDGIHLQIRLTFWWRILDERGLETFYLVVDREIHKATDTDQEQVLIPEGRTVDPLSRRVPDREPASEHHAAEIWIRKIVESCTRNLVSGTTANLALVQLTTVKGDSSSTVIPEAPDLLSANLRNMVQAEIERYGFYVDRIAIQDVQLPSELQCEIHELYKAKFIPARSALEAEERYNSIKRSLDAVKQVIGAEATAVREILSSLKSNFLYGGIPPQLEVLLAPFMKALTGQIDQSQNQMLQGSAAQPLVQPSAQKN
jgi:DNA-directed RNA polymerase subunit M/transcription elongation factor TFIIS/regulator of protease activity HflC (stomatin/prohibitin superfamily)